MEKRLRKNRRTVDMIVFIRMYSLLYPGEIANAQLPSGQISLSLSRECLSFGSHLPRGYSSVQLASLSYLPTPRALSPYFSGVLLIRHRRRRGMDIGVGCLKWILPMDSLISLWVIVLLIDIFTHELCLLIRYLFAPSLSRQLSRGPQLID